MKRLVRLGMTGGIACGKTTVAQGLKRKGAFIICADEAARLALQKGSEGWRRTVRAFGKTILKADGEVDRKKLGAIVFGNEKRRAKLESIIHPLVRRRWRGEMARCMRGGKYQVVVVDVPLLYEVNVEGLFDAVLVVATSGRTQRARMRERGFSAREAERRIAVQWPLQRKIDLADFVIWNDGSLKLLRQQVSRIWKTISDR